jgi:hypothetical protein
MLVAPFFLSLITAFHISLGLHKGLQATGEAFSTSKHEIPSLFFNFFAFLDPDLHILMRTRVRIQRTKINADPDP